MSETFRCDSCARSVVLALLCQQTQTTLSWYCLACFGCDGSHFSDEIAGTVVWTAGEGWRGLGSPPPLQRCCGGMPPGESAS